MDLVQGFQLASNIHSGQLDKAGRPYIEHVARVLLRVQARGGDHIQQLAALFHDAIEDRLTAEGLLEAGVPREAVDLVRVLSRREGEPYTEYVERVARVARAVLVKLADLDDNKDPVRLALLPEKEAARLARKYSRATAVLQSSGSPLSLWNGRAYSCRSPGDPRWDGVGGKGRQHAYVAAHSMADARRVIEEYCGRLPSDSELRVYWSEGWGEVMDGVEPERGLWLDLGHGPRRAL